MIKTKVIGRVFRQDEIADQIYDMWIETELAQGARPGQFVCVYTKNAAALLPRPISICEVNEEKTMLIIEGIGYDATAKAIWQKLVNDSRVGITFDLYYCGIAFFDKRFKQNYIVNF